MEISGKKVVVIGGASGMGRATAELLTERGADVAVLDREGSDGKQVAEGIGGSFYPVDVTDYAGTESTLASAVDDLGGLHVVLTTAGGGVAEKTFGKAFGNMRELAELAVKAQTQAWEVIQKRFQENIADLSNLLRPQK